MVPLCWSDCLFLYSWFKARRSMASGVVSEFSSSDISKRACTNNESSTRSVRCICRVNCMAFNDRQPAATGYVSLEINLKGFQAHHCIDNSRLELDCSDYRARAVLAALSCNHSFTSTSTTHHESGRSSRQEAHVLLASIRKPSSLPPHFHLVVLLQLRILRLPLLCRDLCAPKRLGQGGAVCPNCM